jgi:hypothetical protein
MPDSYAADIVGMMGNEEKALAHLKNILPPKGEKTFGGESRELIEQAIQNIESGAYKSRSGSLYKADLPDDMIDRLLDWDKPLSEQPAGVRKLFPSLDEATAIDAEMTRLSEAALTAGDINSPAQAAWDAMYKSPRYKLAKVVVDEANPKLKGKFANGEEVYKAIGGGKDKVASETLRSLGISGIRYLDAGSRGKGGTETRNFVVFPGEEKKVRILERDGQKASPQKIAQALEATPTTAKRLTALPTVNPGDVVDGYKVRPDIPNQSSIAASFDNYEVLPGIRSINMTDFDPQYVRSISPDKLDSRTRKLMDEISQSKELNPLIVAYDSKGPYIIEGAHRFDALIASKAKKVPAMVVIDMDDPPK